MNSSLRRHFFGSRPRDRRLVFVALATIGMALLLGFPAAALAAAPDVSTSDVFSTGATTATVDGVVSPGGKSTTYAAQYDLNSSDWCQNGTGSPAHTTAFTPLVPQDNGFYDVTVSLNGLTGGTDYCAQLVATNSDGTTEGGPPVEWTQGVPGVLTTDASPSGPTTATVDGTVNPTGQSTQYAVQYDLQSSDWCQNFADPAFSPANTTTPETLGFTDDTDHDVSVNLTGLTPGAEYCAQLIATNGSGEGDGFTSPPWTQPALPQFALTISSIGSGSGVVTSSPAGINCGATCSANFAQGTQVTLTATPANGSTFSGWSGSGCSGTVTCVVTMSAAQAASASFTTVPTPPPVTHTLTVARAGIGSGTVSSSPAGISCGSACSTSFIAGTQVTLTATPASGSNFVGWSGGGCSGTGTCTVTLGADQTVTATFNAVLKPPASCKVPKLKGKTLAAAKTALKKAHCGVGKVTKSFSTKVKTGRVIAQKPAPGSKHPAGTKVKLTVSKGRKPS